MFLRGKVVFVKKEKSIIWLRCIATLLITNSHFTRLYPGGFSFLSFGGLFGNSLFFLLSGYCLTNIRTSFPEWYFKRIKRLYLPYALLLPFLLLSAHPFFPTPLYILFPIEPFHFLPTIITLYPVYYLCLWLHQKGWLKLYHSLAFAVAFQLLYYFLILDYRNANMTQHYSVLGLTSYLIIMLLGGILKMDYVPKPLRDRRLLIPGAAVAFVFYVAQSFFPFSGVLKILQWILAIMFAFCVSAALITFEERLPVFRLENRLADMTLEIYIVQQLIIGPFATENFPVGIILCVISIFAVACCLHEWTLFVERRLKL